MTRRGQGCRGAGELGSIGEEEIRRQRAGGRQEQLAGGSGQLAGGIDAKSVEPTQSVESRVGVLRDSMASMDSKDSIDGAGSGR